MLTRRSLLPSCLLIALAAIHPLRAQQQAAPAASPDHPAAPSQNVPAQAGPPKPLFDPRTYGARGDGATYDTAALQKAINACAGSGGSVYLAGGRFLSAQLILRGGMTFYIERGAVLLGGTNPADYPILLPPGAPDSALRRSLLYAVGADHLTLDGQGAIDGQGQLVQMFGKEPNRPSLIRIFSSKEVTVRNLTLNNPRMWTQIYLDCQNLTIDHITVNAPPKYCPNLDGMDLCDCSNALVTHCRINSDDDSICLKTHDANGLHNITIENNEIRNTGANAIKLGTASSGPVSGIRILNNKVLSAALGGICIESVDGSAINDVLVRGLELTKVSQPVFIRLAHRSHTPGSISGITIEDVRALHPSFARSPSCTITGIPGARIGGVLIKNCYFQMPGGVAAIPRQPPEKENSYPQSSLFGLTPAYGFYVRHASGVVFDHVTVGYEKPDVRPWLASDDATVQTVACRDLKLIKPKAPRRH